jgi:HEAT repeat protein
MVKRARSRYGTTGKEKPFDKSHISRIENGGYRPTKKLLIALLKLYHERGCSDLDPNRTGAQTAKQIAQSFGYELTTQESSVILGIDIEALSGQASTSTVTAIELHYRQMIAWRFGRVEIGYGEQGDLDHWWVPVTLWPMSDENGQSITKVPMSDLVDKFMRVQVIGEVGQGKSWLLRYMARQLAQGTMGNAIPIVVDSLLDFAREAAEAQEHTLLDYALEDILQGQGKPVVPPQQVRDWLTEQESQGRAIYLLDGWDQVPIKHQHVVKRAIRRVGRYIITSHPGQRWNDDNLEVTVRLANWSDDQAWSLAIRHAQKSAVVRALWESASTTSSLRTNPLLLNLAYQLAANGKLLPSTYSAVLSEVVTLALEQAQGKTGTTPGQVELTRRVLSEIALQGYTDDSGVQRRFSHHRVSIALGRRELDDAQQEAVWNIAMNSRLLTPLPRERNMLQFSHSLIQAHLAAEELAGRKDWLEVIKEWQACASREKVIIGVAYLLSQERKWEDVTNLVNHLLKIPDRFGFNVMLAGHCLAEMSTDRPDAVNSLARQVGWQLVRSWVSSPTYQLTDMIEDVLVLLPEPAVAHELSAVAQERGYGLLQPNAVRLLGRTGAAKTLLDLAPQTGESLLDSIHEAMGETNDERVISWLRTCPKDESAIRALGQLRKPEAIDILLEWLDDLTVGDNANYRRRKVICDALACAGGPATWPHIIDQLAHRLERPEVSNGELQALVSSLGPPDSVDKMRLMWRVMHHTNSDVCNAAASKLRSLEWGSDRVVQWLEGTLREGTSLNEQADIRDAWNYDELARSLGRLQTPLGQRRAWALVKDTSLPDRVRWAVGEGLARHPDAGVALLAQDLLNRDDDEQGRIIGTYLLKHLGPLADLHRLNELLDDPLDEVRREAVEALVRLVGSDAAPILRQRLLLETNLNVRQAVVVALGQIKAIQVVDVLEQLAGEGTFPISQYAVQALGEIGGEEGELALMNLWERVGGLGYDDMRRAMVLAMGQCGRPRAVSKLISLTSQRESEMRLVALDALKERVANREADGVILDGLSDPDPDVRWACARAAGRVVTGRIVEMLLQLQTDAEEWVAQAALDSLRSLSEQCMTNERVISSLIDGLEHDDVRTRRAAACVLRKIDVTAEYFYAVETALVKAVDDANEAVRGCIVEGLARYATAPARQVLRRIVSDTRETPVVRRRAALSLGVIGEPKDGEILWRMFEEADKGYRLQPKESGVRNDWLMLRDWTLKSLQRKKYLPTLVEHELDRPLCAVATANGYRVLNNGRVIGPEGDVE